MILVTCKNEEDPLKNKDSRVATTQNMNFSNTQELIQDIVVILVTCKNEEDPMKNKDPI